MSTEQNKAVSPVVDGKIVEHDGIFDMLGFMQQLGAMPPANR